MNRLKLLAIALVLVVLCKLPAIAKKLPPNTSSGSAIQLSQTSDDSLGYDWMGGNIFAVYGATKPLLIENMTRFANDTQCQSVSIASGEVSAGWLTRDLFMVACS